MFCSSSCRRHYRVRDNSAVDEVQSRQYMAETQAYLVLLSKCGQLSIHDCTPLVHGVALAGQLLSATPHLGRELRVHPVHLVGRPADSMKVTYCCVCDCYLHAGCSSAGPLCDLISPAHTKDFKCDCNPKGSRFVDLLL